MARAAAMDTSVQVATDLREPLPGLQTAAYLPGPTVAFRAVQCALGQGHLSCGVRCPPCDLASSPVPPGSRLCAHAHEVIASARELGAAPSWKLQRQSHIGAAEPAWSHAVPHDHLDG